MASDPIPEENDEGQVVLPIEETLDLHTFAPRDVPGVVNDYLEECARRGLREVRLIHGRGTGTQRAIVQTLLARHPLVEEFADAPPDRGGWGATVVRVREGQPPG
jgi:dsDNA-specific endonuclease/ATPase MutS2